MEGTLPPSLDADRRWQWCMELLEGLKYLHENNIVHRDVQPSNVLISRANTYAITCGIMEKLIRQGENCRLWLFEAT